MIISKSGQFEDENDYIQKGEIEFINLDIDPNYFIEEIILDPRLSDIQVDIYSNIIKKVGYNGKVNKSQLYQNLP